MQVAHWKILFVLSCIIKKSGSEVVTLRFSVSSLSLIDSSLSGGT